VALVSSFFGVDAAAACGRGYAGRGDRRWPSPRVSEPASNLDRVKAGLPPACALVARAMHRAMIPAVEWDRELIADLAAERVAQSPVPGQVRNAGRALATR
jgi:hypothetical protein